MNDHALTARELHSQTKSEKKQRKLDFQLTDRAEGLNRSADNISQDDELGAFDRERANATMPEGELNQDGEEGIDENFFYGGSPNKAGLQSRRQTLNAQPLGRKSLNCLEIDRTRTSDTMIMDKSHSELQELKQIRMQNLTSLVNNPKRDTFLNKIGSAVKNKIDSKRNVHKKGYQQRQIYKPLTEKEVPNNSHIPKVKKKEMQRHLQSMKVLAGNYLKNREKQEQQRVIHMQREIRASKKGPFEVEKQIEDRKVQQSERSQSSSSRKNINPEDIVVPSEFFNSNYAIDKTLLTLQTSEEIKPHIDKYQKYLAHLNADLEIKILKNFDFFNKSFHKFDEMKDDMKIVSQKSQLIRNAHQQLKYYQLCNMIKLYRLQRKRINTNRVSDVLRSLTALQQSVPVIDNLITNAQKAAANQNSKESTQNFQLGLELIAHANDLINNKLSGVAVTECYRDKLIRLKGQCCKKIEESCVSQVDIFLKQKILARNFGAPADPENVTQLSQMVSDIIQSKGEEDESNYKFLFASIVNNWSFFDFSKVTEGSLTNAVQNFPVLSDVFLDGNDKLQTSAGQQDFVSSISNTVGVNLDILIRDIKRKHQELLKQGNFQILEQVQTLTNELSEEAYKNRVSISPISAQLAKEENADGIAAARTCQRPKLILQFITKCIIHLYQPDLAPAFPISHTDMQKSLQDRQHYRDKLLDLLLGGFVLQAILIYQMSRAFELIEIWITDSVKQWQQKQKESQQYLLLHTRDQKQIQRKHELVIGQILDQFAEQKTQLSGLMQKNFDKSLAVIIEQQVETRQVMDENGAATDKQSSTNVNLLHFLIQYLKPPLEESERARKFNDHQMGWNLDLQEQRKNDFLKVCRVLQNITNWTQGKRQDEFIRSLKSQSKKNLSLVVNIQLQSVQQQLQSVQKMFVTHFKEQVIQKLLLYLDNQEKFIRCKTIDQEDETEVVARLLSQDFSIVEEIKPQDKSYPSDSLHVPEIFDIPVDNKNNQQQQDSLKLDDEEIQIKQKPLPKSGFKILSCVIVLNQELDSFIQTIEFDLPQQREKKTCDFLIQTLEIINFFNTNLKGQIIDCGAFYTKRVDKITAKHLALVRNSCQFIQNVILPSLYRNIFQNETRQHGVNGRKFMTTMFEEVNKELTSHIEQIRQKFIQIIIDLVQKKIEEGAKIDWDKSISKGEMIQASNHIQHITKTLSQMYKVLQSNLSMENFEIQDQIMQVALERILELLEKLYIDSIKESNSKYAKKRIKVDVKIFLKNLQTDQILQFTPIFTYLHFDLLVSMDRDDLQESLDKSEEPKTDIQRIQVIDHYSKIKQSIKNILINRCSLKYDELNQYCNFQLQEQLPTLEKTKTQKLENDILEAAPQLEKSKTMMPGKDASLPKEEESAELPQQQEDNASELKQIDQVSQSQPEEPVSKEEIVSETVQKIENTEEIVPDQQQVQNVEENTTTIEQTEEIAEPLHEAPQEVKSEPPVEQNQLENDENEGVTTIQQPNETENNQIVEKQAETNESQEDLPIANNDTIEDPEPKPHSNKTSPGKLGGLGKLDLSKVEAKKQEDDLEQQEGDESETKPSAEPLVSERELEELYEENQQKLKQNQKKMVRSLWSARKSKRADDEDELQMEIPDSTPADDTDIAPDKNTLRSNENSPRTEGESEQIKEKSAEQLSQDKSEQSTKTEEPAANLHNSQQKNTESDENTTGSKDEGGVTANDQN